MTKGHEVNMKRVLTKRGIVINGTCYNSETVQMLRNIMHPGTSLDIRMELLVPDRIYVFNPIRDFWFKVRAVEYPRLATHREIEGMTRNRLVPTGRRK